MFPNVVSYFLFVFFISFRLIDLFSFFSFHSDLVLFLLFHIPNSFFILSSCSLSQKIYLHISIYLFIHCLFLFPSFLAPSFPHELLLFIASIFFLYPVLFSSFFLLLFLSCSILCQCKVTLWNLPLFF